MGGPGPEFLSNAEEESPTGKSSIKGEWPGFSKENREAFPWRTLETLGDVQGPTITLLTEEERSSEKSILEKKPTYGPENNPIRGRSREEEGHLGVKFATAEGRSP